MSIHLNQFDPDFILILILVVVWRRPWATTTLGLHSHLDNSVHLHITA